MDRGVGAIGAMLAVGVLYLGVWSFDLPDTWSAAGARGSNADSRWRIVTRTELKVCTYSTKISVTGLV